jgi:hypothetical protein
MQPDLVCMLLGGAEIDDAGELRISLQSHFAMIGSDPTHERLLVRGGAVWIFAD